MDTAPILSFFQLLDPSLLHLDLQRSLWHLHMQPPLYNLLTGLILKLSIVHTNLIISFLFVFLSFLSCCAIIGSLKRLGMSRNVAVASGLIWTSTPAFLSYENLYFYPHLSQSLIIFTGYCFIRSANSSWKWALAAIWMLTVLVCLRSLFHPVILIIGVASALHFLRAEQRKSFLIYSSIPLALVTALIIKNFLLFGFIGTSSWFGNSLHRVVTKNISYAALEDKVEDATVSPLTLKGDFDQPKEYLKTLNIEERNWNVPALDMPNKPSVPINSINYNHWVYPIVSKELSENAWALMRSDPTLFTRSIGQGIKIFFQPVTENTFLALNRVKIEGLIQLSEKITGNLAYAVFLIIHLLASVFLLLIKRRQGTSQYLFIQFHIAIVVWVLVVGNCFEIGENNRFRYQSMASWWVLVVVNSKYLWDKYKAKGH
jgi:hypothetical protein